MKTDRVVEVEVAGVVVDGKTGEVIVFIKSKRLSVLDTIFMCIAFGRNNSGCLKTGGSFYNLYLKKERMKKSSNNFRH